MEQNGKTTVHNSLQILKVCVSNDFSEIAIYWVNDS